MKVEWKERIICCLLAVILCFMGMCVETTTISSSVSYAFSENESTLQPVSYIVEEAASCTPNMLSKTNNIFVRNNTANSSNRWNSKAALVVLLAGAFLQDLFYYQNAQGREDGQLFLCRSVAVDYIHLKDSGE